MRDIWKESQQTEIERGAVLYIKAIIILIIKYQLAALGCIELMNVRVLVGLRALSPTVATSL